MNLGFETYDLYRAVNLVLENNGKVSYYIQFRKERKEDKKCCEFRLIDPLKLSERIIHWLCFQLNCFLFSVSQNDQGYAQNSRFFSMLHGWFGLMDDWNSLQFWTVLLAQSFCEATWTWSLKWLKYITNTYHAYVWPGTTGEIKCYQSTYVTYSIHMQIYRLRIRLCP